MRYGQSLRRRGLGKQLLTLLLSLTLICSLFMPMTAYADEGEAEASVTEMVSEQEGYAEAETEVQTTPAVEQAETQAEQESASAESVKETTKESAVESSDSTDETKSETEKEKESKQEKEKTYSAACGTASVTAIVSPGSFKEEVSLRITELGEGEAAYKQAENALSAALEYDEMRAYDICFVNSSGAEIEPELPVSVQIQANLMNADEVSGNAVQVSHIENGAQIVATAAVNDDAVSAAFTVDSFSTFTLSWMQGNQTISSLPIICLNKDGKEIGNATANRIYNESDISSLAPTIPGYAFSKAVIAVSAEEAAKSDAVQARRIRYNNNYPNRGWQYREQNGSTLKNLKNNEKIYFIYEESPLVVNVAVFVAGKDLQGNKFSDDMLKLLNVATLNHSGYYGAGTVQIDLSKLSGGATSKNLTAADWAYVRNQLKSTFDASNAPNDKSNKIADYIDQIIEETNQTQGAMHSGLWVSSGANADGVKNVTVVDANGIPKQNGGNSWHLDLVFSTVHINYIYGNNGIGSGNSKDGNVAGSKVFIKGATMDFEPVIEAPAGYKIVGYYKDPDCTDGQQWSAIGQPINEDTNVYIKLVPKNDVVINYVVQEGEGTVTDPGKDDIPVQNGMEHFNPVTGQAKGSTAAPDANWEFKGWYKDAACTEKVSDDAKYVPQTPDGGWPEGVTYTYYAKFERKTVDITVTKQVAGNMGDKSKKFNFELTAEGQDGTTSFALANGDSKSIKDLPVGSKITLKETNYGKYTVTAAYDGEDVTVTDGRCDITLDENKKEIIVTNRYDDNPDTGISFDSVPYILMLFILAGVAAVFFFHRRRTMR